MPRPLPSVPVRVHRDPDILKIFDRVSARESFLGLSLPNSVPLCARHRGNRHLIFDEGFLLYGKPFPHGNPVRRMSSSDVETLRMICGARE